MTDFSDMARDIIESNRYMVLGTADEAGVPWVTPVWYAQSDYRRFADLGGVVFERPRSKALAGFVGQVRRSIAAVGR